MFFDTVYVQLVVDFWYIFQEFAELVNLHLIVKQSEVIRSADFFLITILWAENQRIVTHHTTTKLNSIV